MTGDDTPRPTAHKRADASALLLLVFRRVRVRRVSCACACASRSRTTLGRAHTNAYANVHTHTHKRGRARMLAHPLSSKTDGHAQRGPADRCLTTWFRPAFSVALLSRAQHRVARVRYPPPPPPATKYRNICARLILLPLLLPLYFNVRPRPPLTPKAPFWPRRFSM